jgi:hypothetical protein
MNILLFLTKINIIEYMKQKKNKKFNERTKKINTLFSLFEKRFEKNLKIQPKV